MAGRTKSHRANVVTNAVEGDGRLGRPPKKKAFADTACVP